MSGWRGAGVALALVAGLGPVGDARAAVSGSVEIVERADGTKFVFNRAPATLRAAHLRPVAADPAAVEELIERHARRRRLDAGLVRAVVAVESAFRPRALSRKGAMGLMQLMPATAVALAVADPYDPEQNVRGGTDYLRQMLDVFGGDLELALAAYNAGPDAVRRHGGVPPYPETRDYVKKVMGLYRGESYSLAAPSRPARGRPTFVFRDRDGRLLLTTSPPGD